MIHPFGLFFTKPPAPPMWTFSVSVITLAPSQIHAIYLFYSSEHCNELNYYYYYYYYYFTFTDRSISSVSQYAVWFVISDGNSNELWNGLGKLFWLIFVLISEYSELLNLWCIERFHSRDQYLCKFIGTKEYCLHKKRNQLPEDWFGTPTWPPFYCFETTVWPPWHHMKLKNWFVCLRDCLSMESVTCDHYIRRWEQNSISMPRVRAERQRPSSTPALRSIRVSYFEPKRCRVDFYGTNLSGLYLGPVGRRLIST